MMNIGYLTLTVICMFLISDANALWCFECNSFSSLDQCNNLDKMGPYYRVCEPKKSENNTLVEFNRPLCRKMKQKIKVRNNLKITKYSCGYILHQHSEEDLCYENRYEDYEEVVCQCFSDGCNSSKQIYASSTLVFTFGILSLLVLSFSAE